ncbi:MAG: hypothetical protein AAGN35_13900 [Bacteroidota bacterium]
MNTLKLYLMLALSLLLGGSAGAQIPGTNIPPREDDHFQRWLVVNRIDLDEKINQPIVATQEPGLYESSKYGETNGVVTALINGLKSGKYLAYDPDSLNKTLTYEDVVAMAQRMNGSEEIEDPETDLWTEDPWGEEMEEENESGLVDPFFNEEDSDPESPYGFEVAPFESVLEFIENRIVDKNRSSVVNDIKYIRLVWVDPGETLPDKNFICLKFADVLETLEDTQWKNKYNDAECRNMREVFELRMFHGFLTNVSGRGVRTLPESDFRQNQLLAFEHHLWSF